MSPSPASTASDNRDDDAESVHYRVYDEAGTNTLSSVLGLSFSSHWQLIPFKCFAAGPDCIEFKRLESFYRGHPITI